MQFKVDMNAKLIFKNGALFGYKNWHTEDLNKIFFAILFFWEIDQQKISMILCK